jgi:hypothetical protein
MRVAMLTLLGLLVVGCASPLPPKKPSPYRYTTHAPFNGKEPS